MIRHITSDICYEKIIEDKEIKNPGLHETRYKDEYDKISFENYNNNDILVYLVGKSKIRINEKIKSIIVIYIDENELDSNNIIFTSSKNGIKDKNCSTKEECIFYFNMDNKNENYMSIGEYVHVMGPIPINKIDHIEIFDIEKLDHIPIQYPELKNIKF